MSKPIEFSDYKEQIINAIDERKDHLNITEKVILIDGFINQPIYDKFTGGFVVGGPMIPMVAALGQKSGRIYFFALKALINIEI